MSFVDKFILEENLEDFELDNADYPEIALGIIIGNLEKIRISGRFIDSLKQNEKINPIIKAVFLKKILQSFNEELKTVSDKTKQHAYILIQRFNIISDLLYQVIQTACDLKDVLETLYKEQLNSILKKFSIMDSLITVGIHAYKLKNFLRLQTSFFYLDEQDLINIHQRRYNEPQLYLNLFSKCCEIVFSHSLAPGDCISIITFNSFYEFCQFVLESEFTVDYIKIIQVLTRFKNNFTHKQKMRFQDFYSKLLKNGRIRSPIESFELAYKDESPFTVRKVNQQTYNKVRSSNDAPRPLKYDFSKPLQNPSYFQPQKPYNTDWELEKDLEKHKSIKTEVQDLLNTLKYYSSSEIDIEILASNLKDLQDTSQIALHYHLASFSFYERDFTPASIQVWKLILKALKSLQTYPDKDLSLLKSHVFYLESQLPH